MTSTDFTISDVFPVAEFRAWVLTKPAGERYDYDCNENCALGQFLRETGRASSPNVGDRTWDDLDDLDRAEDVPFDPRLNEAVAHGDRTFGSLATRLEALEPKSAWTRSDAYLNDLELARA